MIIGHRTKPDSERTIVFKVTFPIHRDHRSDTFELSKEDAEQAILKRLQYETLCRKQTFVDDMDE